MGIKNNLTFRDYGGATVAFADTIRVETISMKDPMTISGPLVDRLHAFEKIGLEPEEIIKLKNEKANRELRRLDVLELSYCITELIEDVIDMLEGVVDDCVKRRDDMATIMCDEDSRKIYSHKIVAENLKIKITQENIDVLEEALVDIKAAIKKGE